MKPLEFPQQNCVYAKDQKEYQPLPVHKTDLGTVISCWGMTWRERIKVLCAGRIWWSVMTFNQPLQPQLPLVGNPFVEVKTTRREILVKLWTALVGWVRHLVGPVRLPEGGIMPYWMAVAYFDYCRREAVMYAVPLHYLVSLAWRLNRAWSYYRQRESWIEKEINQAIEKERAEQKELANLEIKRVNRDLGMTNILMAAILLRCGGSLTLNNQDIMRVPPSFIIERTEDKIFGRVRITFRYRA